MESSIKSKRKIYKKASDNVMIIKKRRPMIKTAPDPPQAPPKEGMLSRDFLAAVRRDMAIFLPKKPYIVGIHKDLFELLKLIYPDQQTKLLKAIKINLKYIVNSYKYYNSIIYGECRHGVNFNTEQITDGEREFAKQQRREVFEIRNKAMAKRKKFDKKFKQKHNVAKRGQHGRTQPDATDHPGAKKPGANLRHR